MHLLRIFAAAKISSVSLVIFAFLYNFVFFPGVVQNPVLEEASGLAASRIQPGILYSHNDHGGDAEVFVFTDDGVTVGVITLEGVGDDDYEDIASLADFYESESETSDAVRLIIPEGTTGYTNAILNREVASTPEDFREVSRIEERRQRLTENNLIFASKNTAKGKIQIFPFKNTLNCSQIDLNRPIVQW